MGSIINITRKFEEIRDAIRDLNEKLGFTITYIHNDTSIIISNKNIKYTAFLVHSIMLIDMNLLPLLFNYKVTDWGGISIK